jgi:hypothetical protein
MSRRGTSVTVPMHCDRLAVDAPVIASREKRSSLPAGTRTSVASAESPERSPGALLWSGDSAG